MRDYPEAKEVGVEEGVEEVSAQMVQAETAAPGHLEYPLLWHPWVTALAEQARPVVMARPVVQDRVVRVVPVATAGGGAGWGF